MASNISQATSANTRTGALSGGRQHPSGTGRTDGSPGGHAGSRSPVARPSFDAAVARGGYRWWYIDATSDDGQHGLTIIGFVGSVFSPYYHRARNDGPTSAENHCAINVALYGSPRRWAMTERGASRVQRTQDSFVVGPSCMRWSSSALSIDIHERCMPLPFSLLGRVTLTPTHLYNEPVVLDSSGKHHWQAIAPDARISVAFENPKLSWSGNAYHDMNWGEEPLEQAFKNWTWLRAKTPRGTHVLYDVTRKDGSRFSFGRVFQNGKVKSRDVPDQWPLPRGLWGMTRPVNSEAKPQLMSKLEDAPFYTRNRVAMTLDGESTEAIHESLSLERFSHPVVQLMLPFRMPRIA